MKRKPRILVIAIALMLGILLIPAVAMAQETTSDDEGLLLRVNGPVTIAEGETIDNVVVVSDNVTVDGTITGTLFVINGDATINGQIDDTVTMVNGTLTLGSAAQTNDVSVFRGTLVQDEGSTISGSLTESDFQVSPWEWGLFSVFLWFGATIVVLLAGLVFAAIGGRQVKLAGDATIHDLGPTLLGIIALWIALPILMVLALITLVGIPLGVGYFFFVLPIAWFLGYLVAGTQIGRMIVRSRSDVAHPYLAAIIGLLLLQIIGILPVLGGLLGFLAGVIGSGGLTVLAWRAWRGHPVEPQTPQVQETTPRPAS